MDRDLLPHLPVVLAVARRGAFAAAAAELGMSPSAVSHAVRLMEERLGAPLFARTTRSVALTEAGAALVEACGPAMRDVAEAAERIRSGRGGAAGLLRLNAPSIAVPLVVMPLVAAMVERHPAVRVEIFLDNGLADIVEGGFDAGIRLGEMIAEDMVAVRLTPPFRAIVVASPDHLDRWGRPARVSDLAEHACIGYRMVSGGGLYRWELREDGRDVAVDVPGPLIVNDAVLALEMARAGLGLAYVFEPLAAADLAAGRLVEVLPHAAIEEPGLFLYHTRRASEAPKLRAFLDTARAVLRPHR